jgi:tight adherence protein B
MLIVGLFLLVLLLTFVIVVFVTKPSSSEKRLSQRLETIGQPTELTANAEPEDIRKRDTLSDVPWVDSLLVRFPASFSVKNLIAEAGSNWTVGRFLAGTALAFVATAWFANFWVPNIVFVLVLAVVAAAGPYMYLRFKRASRFRRFNAVLPDAIDLMSRALKAGHSITSAVEMVAQEISDPVGAEFRRLFEEQNFGLPLREAMLNLIKRVPIADLQFLVTAILVQKETGGNLVEVLDKTAGVLRDRMRLQGQLRIYTAQGRMTGWILCILPFVVFGLISLVNPQYARILTQDPLGQKMIAVGMILMILGVWVIRRIVDIKV